MVAVAMQNFRAVDRLLATSAEEASASIEKLGKGPARQLLRYQASELNRFYFTEWERVQLLLGAVLIVTVVFADRTGPQRLCSLAAALLLWLAVAAQHFFITPQVIGLGRLIDFTPSDAPSVYRDQFWRLHHLYSAVELFKLALAAALSGAFLVGWCGDGRVRRTADAGARDPEMKLIR